MAYPTIKLKKSSVPGKVPVAGDLAFGELAVNYNDGKLYYKNSTNAIKTFLDSGNLIDLIDSAYVQARQAAAPPGGFDSADFNSLFATKSTTNLSEGTNKYYTKARADSDAKRAISVTDAGGDGSISYVPATGIITYTGPSASEVRAHFSAGQGIKINSGVVSLDSADSAVFASIRTTGNATVGGNLTIDGNFYVGGTTTTITAKNLAISDNMIYLNNAIQTTISNVVGSGTAVTYTTIENHNYQIGFIVTITGVNPSAYNLSNQTITGISTNSFTIANAAVGLYVSGGVARAKSTSNPDLGLAFAYYDSSYHHGGFFRDATDGYFKVFHKYDPEPDSSVFINTAHASFALADIQANNFRGALIGNASTATTAATLTTGQNFSLTGEVTAPAISFNGSGAVALATTIAANAVDSSNILALSVSSAKLQANIPDSKLATIATAGKVSNSATTATDANTTGAIVARNGSGNFSAGTITAALTGAASSNVLKAGDTMTGKLNTAGNDTARLIETLNTSASSAPQFYIEHNLGATNVGNARGVLNLVSTGALTIGGSVALTASNYNTYSPTLTGTGASGNWGINVTGSAATLTTAQNFSLTGEVTAPAISFNGSGAVALATTIAANAVDSSNILALSVSSAKLQANIPDSKLATIATAGKVSNSATTATDANTASAIVARDASGNFNAGVITAVQVFSTSNGAGLNFKLGDDAWIGDINVANTTRLKGAQDSSQGYIVFGNANTTALGRSGTGSLTYGGSVVVTASNYNTYSPTLTGTGASGNWGINVTGSAATLTTAQNFSLTGEVTAPTISFNGSGAVALATTIAANAVDSSNILALSVSAAKIQSGAITTAKFATGAVDSNALGALSVSSAKLQANIPDTKLATIATAGKVSNSATTATNANTASAIVARDASGNFSAGTITATLTGTASNATTLSTNAETSYLRFRGNIAETTLNDTTTDSARTSGFYRVSYPGASDALLDIGGMGGSTPRVQFRFNYGDDIWFRAARDTETTWDGITSKGKLLLHSSNYNSYAPTLTGTGASGNWGINVTGSAATLTTGRNFSLTGPITAPAISFNGSGVVALATSITAGAVDSAALGALSVSSAKLQANIPDSKLATISTALKVSNSATTATNANTASAIVARDGSGNFSAGTITATLNGNAATVSGFRNLGTITVQAVVGSGLSCTTAQFITWYTTNYSFLSYGYTVAKCSWSYAGNNDISDTVIGTLELAGCTIETFSDGAQYTIRITRPTTGTGAGTILVYNDQGVGYSPGWRILLDNTNYSTYVRGLTGGSTDRTFLEYDQTITTTYSITSSKNALTAGPVTINAGVVVTVPSGSVWTIV